MRIVVDLDGTISELRKEGQSYLDLKPIPGAIDTINRLKEEGHVIIINTARNMKTQDGNLGRVIANVGKQTIDWLDIHNVKYDEIYFGKPFGHIYIDDLAINFNNNWEQIKEHIRENFK